MRNRRLSRGPTVIEPLLMELVRCPVCRSALHPGRERPESLACGRCRAVYPLDDGLPVLLPVDAPGAARQKAAQAAFFDQEGDPEFEVTRPHGTPALHQWLLTQKFRRSVSQIGHLLQGATALTICGGSGMDAEFLARQGARVVVSDISAGAAKRAQARAVRFGLPLLPVVADAESLPFPDHVFDVVYVHDGLHHLERPDRALAEMARVTRGAVSITEPAEAHVTRLAVRLGFALEREPAGNAVARLRRGEIVEQLQRQGLQVVDAQRYALFYRHEPGFAVRLLSSPVILQIAKGAVRLGNLPLGRLGNKLNVQAVRDREALDDNPSWRRARHGGVPTPG